MASRPATSATASLTEMAGPSVEPGAHDSVGRVFQMRTGLVLAAMVCFISLPIGTSWWPRSVQGADPEVLRPRVPPGETETAKALVNPLAPTPANIRTGKKIFEGKGFCSSCHGLDGKGLGHIPGLRGALPRDFTDRAWQRARSDGELMWILQNGSPGTDMAPFIPLVLSEEEAWQVILYVRSLGAP